jgi:hypothetical protein
MVLALANDVRVINRTENKKEHFEVIPLPLGEFCLHHGAHGKDGNFVRELRVECVIVPYFLAKNCQSIDSIQK